MPDSPTLSARCDAEAKAYPLARAFAISRGTKTEARVVEVRLHAEGKTGRGEAVPYPRYGESQDSALEEIAKVADALSAGLTRDELQELMKPGAARAAVDAALWDLEAKLTGVPVWQRAGLPQPYPVTCTETIVLDTPDAMAAAARAARSPLLKLKLGGAEDMERVAAVHEARPEAQLILDANEGLDPSAFDPLMARAAKLGVVLVEQPFPAGKDQLLRRRAPPVAICADESVHTADDVERLVSMYDVVNVKMEKAGGLTAAIELVRDAQKAGMGVMVGCMVGSSLAMAPAMMIATLADYVDLDGPLWLAGDVADGLAYDAGTVSPPSPALWGG